MTPTERAIERINRKITELADEAIDEWYGPYIDWLQYRQARYHKALTRLRKDTNRGVTAA